jgi:hypothetical protein
MANYFSRLTGTRHVIPTYCASALNAGEIVQTVEATGGNVTYELPTIAAAASNAAVLGIVVGTTTAAGIVFVDTLRSGDWVDAPASTTSMDYTYLGKEIDIVDQDSVRVDASTNDDCRVVGWDGKTTFRTWVEFLKVETVA